jgi:hypothetical protein
MLDFPNFDLGRAALAFMAFLTQPESSAWRGLPMLALRDEASTLRASDVMLVSMLLTPLFGILTEVKEATWVRLTGRPALGRPIRIGLFVLFLCAGIITGIAMMCS